MTERAFVPLSAEATGEDVERLLEDAREAMKRRTRELAEAMRALLSGDDDA